MRTVTKSMLNRITKVLHRGYNLLAIALLPKMNVAGIELDVRGLSFRMRSILFHQQYEFCEMTLCRQYIEPGDTVLEIGSGIGFLGLFCLKYLQVAQVVSVEPSPHTVELLKRNYILNGFTPNVIRAAAWSYDGETWLTPGRDFWGDRVINPGLSSGQRLSIPAVTLRTLFGRCGDAFTVLIVDIEGSESELDWRSIPQSVRLIILEIHPQLLDCVATKRTFKQIAECGFTEAKSFGDVVAFTRHSCIAEAADELTTSCIRPT